MTEPDLQRWPKGRVGYVAVVGRPNVGKSTLLNQVLGAHLLAVSPLPQTTRKHWRGILSDAYSQLIFIDTPGAHVGKTVLNRAMLDAVDQSLVEADVVLCLVDPTRPCGAEDDLVARRVAACGKPAVLILNKGDVTDEAARAAAQAFYRERLRPETPVRQLTALTGEGVEPLVAWLREQMPIAPFLFPPDQAMDAVERELGAELIREAALHLLREEVPHALTVSILRWQDGEKKVKIDAELYVERPTQKAILIGKGGTMIAAIRSAASKLLHQWLERRVTLCLHVKVAEDWRNQANFLREQGLLPPADED